MNDLRNIPQVDKIIKNEAFSGLDTSLVTMLARQILDEVRELYRSQSMKENCEFIKESIIRMLYG